MIEEARGVEVKLKVQGVFTSLFKDAVKEYSQDIFPKLFDKYHTTPAKGGAQFKEYSDMSYPMHILSGILPAMLYLEKELLGNDDTFKLIEKEDGDIKILIRCALLGITLHDINKLVGKINLKESLKDLDLIFEDLEIKDKLSNEEKNIIKYLVISAEDGTRYTISDIELPKRRNLDRIIKDYLLKPVHLADSISIPPEESFSRTFGLIQTKLQEYFPEVHALYFDESPYEAINRYLLIKLIHRVNGKILLISPKGFIWTGTPLERDKNHIEKILQEIETEYQDLLLDGLDSFLACDWQKAQLDVFRYVSPTKDFVKEKLIPELLERKREAVLYHGLPSDITRREEIKREIEKLENSGKLDVMLLLKLILTLTPNNNRVKKLKKEIEKRYYAEMKDTTDPVLKNAKKIIDATRNFDGDTTELYAVLVELLTENYKDESINIKEVFESVLSYAYLDGEPLFEIKLEDVGEKQNICSICGAEASIIAREGVAFGFAPRGFTNRTVVSIKNTERKICKTCLAEVMLRKLIFNQDKDLYVVYLDACDYTAPVLNAKNMTRKIEEQINGLRALSEGVFNSYRIFYGYQFKDSSENMMIPFLMSHLQAGKEADFLRSFYELLVFANNTGFKVYLTYALNPDRIKKETFVLDCAPKSIKALGWDTVRIDELQHVREEFEILMRLAQKVGGRRRQNEFVRILNDYSTFPLAFFYHLYRLDNPFSFINSNKIRDKIQLVYERIGGETMGVIEKLANKGSDISWSGYTASKQTWIIRTAIDGMKLGVQRNLEKEDIIALMVGMIYKKAKLSKIETVEDFCNSVYEDLYKKTWQGRIPSKTELKYWIYGFAVEYAKRSEEKREVWREKKEAKK